jgi:hypothetical protein
VDIACSGNDVYVVWQDFRNGWPDVYLNRSADGGVTWLAQDVRMDTDALGAAMSLAPRVAVAPPYVYVVWTDLRNGLADVYLRRSGDGGATWTAADARVDTDAPGAGSSSNPVVTAVGSLAYVAWEDQRSGAPAIRLSRTADGGVTWLGTDLRLDTDVPGATASWRPVLYATANTVVAAWEDYRPGTGDVRSNRSTDGGLTWLGSDVRLATDVAGAALSTGIVIAGSGQNVFVAWQDLRNGAAYDVYLNASLDGGATWRTSDVRLDTDAAGANSSNVPQVAASGQRVRVVWEDQRNGPAEILFTQSDP